MTVTIDALSRETVFEVVEGKSNGVPVDPTSFPLTWAFKAPPTKPDPAVSGDWVTGQWELSGRVYLATCLVGRGSLMPLVPGTYRMWQRWITTAEDVIKPGDILEVT